MLTDKEKEDATIKQATEEEERNKAEKQSLAAQAVSDGDVTDELFKDQDANGTRNLCNTLNNDAINKRDAALERQFHSAAIAGLHSNVVVVEDPIAVKSYMKSASKEGLKAKAVYMDFSQ